MFFFTGYIKKCPFNFNFFKTFLYLYRLPSHQARPQKRNLKKMTALMMKKKTNTKILMTSKPLSVPEIAHVNGISITIWLQPVTGMVLAPNYLIINLNHRSCLY